MRCEYMLPSGARPRRCSRRATVHEDGGNWCTQHTPSAVAARDAERNIKQQRDRDIRELEGAIGDARDALVKAARLHHRHLPVPVGETVDNLEVAIHRLAIVRDEP